METQKAFVAALIKARSQFKSPIKDMAGQFPYAGLGSIKNAIEQPLADNGITFTFHILSGDTEKGDMLKLIVEHSGGEQRFSLYPMLTTQSSSRQNEHQTYGASLSYAMRNLLRTYFALDSDNNDPDNRPAPQQFSSGPPIMSSPSAQSAPSGQQVFGATAQRGTNYGNPNKTVSEKQVALISRLLSLTSTDKDEILDKYGVESLGGLNGQQGSELISDLKKKDDDFPHV